MRFADVAKFILVSFLVVGTSAMGARPARAAEPYCPNPSHQQPQQVPANLVARVAKALQIDAAPVPGETFVRCAGAILMGCSIGANLVCGKADTRRQIPGATKWCHDNPGETIIPMFATGHATIYEWSCVGGRAVPGKAVVAVDSGGYIAENWQTIP
jgi:hypothetical protein